MDDLKSTAQGLELIGGELCLDFANTVGNHRDRHPEEHLRHYSDLVAWSLHAGILNETTARRLNDRAMHTPGEAGNVLQRAIGLREAIYRIFSARAATGRPRARDLELLNESLARAMSRARLVPHGDSYAWAWDDGRAELDSMLGPIARSAAELLTSPRQYLVRECGGDNCGWLFVDLSKNHSRRWCSMSDCGNREKARRHLVRIRARRSMERLDA